MDDDVGTLGKFLMPDLKLKLFLKNIRKPKKGVRAVMIISVS